MAVLMVRPIVVMMVVRPVMMVRVTVRVVVVMPVVMRVVVAVFMGVFVGMHMRIGRMAWIVGKDQGLHRDRHRLRGHAYAPEVDVVQVPQHHAIDDQDLALHLHFLAQDGAQRLRNVPVKDQKQRFALGKRARHPEHDAAGKSGNPLVGRSTAPTEGQRHVGFALDQVEVTEVRLYAPRQFLGIDVLAAFVGRLNHLQVLSGQQFPGR